MKARPARIQIVAAVGAASLALSGCSALVGGTTEGGGDGGSSTLVVYTAHGPEVTDPIMSLFRESHPDIDVTLSAAAGTGEMISRIESESGNPLGDAAWGGSTEVYDSAAEGTFASVELENDAATVVQDPNNEWHATDLLFQPMVVNTNSVEASDFPDSMLDYTDPKWSDLGQVAFAHPRSSGTSYSLIAAMVTEYGWEYFDDFLPNAAVVDGSAQMFDGVRTGEYVAGFINEDLGATWVAEGAPIELIYPSDAVSNQVGAAAVIEGANNAEAAATFVNFLMSQEAQEVMVEETGRRSAREDIAAPAGLPDVADLNLAEPDPAVFATDKEAVLNRFEEAMAGIN